MFSASCRCLSSTSGTNPFASMLGSVENSSPICTSSLLSASTVSGPPASSGVEVVEEDPVDTRAIPARQKGRWGHSGGAPNVSWLGDAREGAHRGQVEPLSRLRVRHELIRVLGRRWRQQREPCRPGAARRLHGPRRRDLRTPPRWGRGSRSSDERYSGFTIDAARLQGVLRDLSRPQVQLSLDGVAGVLQDLRVHLGHDLVLGEGAGHADDDRPSLLRALRSLVTAGLGAGAAQRQRGTARRRGRGRPSASGRAPLSRPLRLASGPRSSGDIPRRPSKARGRCGPLALHVEDLGRPEVVPIGQLGRRRLGDQEASRALRASRAGSRGSRCRPTGRTRTSAPR